jgi:hypothetical protein
MDASKKDTQQSEQLGEPPIETLPQASGTGRQWIWLVIFGLAVLVLAIGLIRMMRSGSDTRAGANEPIGGRAHDMSPGSEATLYLPGRDSVMVGVDERALDELISAISTPGDGAQTLIQAGRVFTVPNNTRVRIIAAGFAKMRVRILEGDKTMFEVWVPERWVR